MASGRSGSGSALLLPGGVGVLCVLSLLAGQGCYEVPPERPAPESLSPLPPAWPAPPAYGEDRWHPANRWFQRVFGQRGEDGELGPVPPGDRPAPLAAPGAVDRAELLALLERLERDGAPAGAGPAERERLLADLSRVARCYRRAGERELAAAHERAARAVALRSPPRLPPDDASAPAEPVASAAAAITP